MAQACAYACHHCMYGLVSPVNSVGKLDNSPLTVAVNMMKIANRLKTSVTLLLVCE